MSLPMLSILGPMVEKHLNEETVGGLFEKLTAGTHPDLYEKTVVVVSRKSDGSTVYTVADMNDAHELTHIYSQRGVVEALRNEILKP